MPSPLIRKELAALSPAELKVFVWSFGVVKQNALIGIDAVAPHQAKLKRLFSHYTPAAPKLLVLLDALAEANQAVARARPSSKGVQALASPVYVDREGLMAQLTVWGLTGLVPMNEVERIRQGTGKIDAAEDVLAVANLVERDPAVKNAFVGSPQSLTQKVARAKALLAVLKPSGTAERPNHALEHALDDEARVWALVQRQHEALWQEAACLFGRKADEKVPSLVSRTVRRLAASTAEPVSPEPAPAEPQQ